MVSAIDRQAYDEHFHRAGPIRVSANNPDQFVAEFEQLQIGPFYQSGQIKGYVRGLALSRLLATTPPGATVLDAGSGQGALSVYLACRGFNVIGVDISSEACICAVELASEIGVNGRCRFLAESLEATSIPGASIDAVIGFASLHHFIKYPNVPAELMRLLKPRAYAFFADSYGENPIYRLFQNKGKMQHFGDVRLKKRMIEKYFDGFEVVLFPADWFTMLDKLYLKGLPKAFVRRLSRIHFWIDRQIPVCRPTLFLSGSVLTIIRKR